MSVPWSKEAVAAAWAAPRATTWQPRVEEADWRSSLHPRDRLGHWIDKPHSEQHPTHPSEKPAPGSLEASPIEDIRGNPARATNMTFVGTANGEKVLIKPEQGLTKVRLREEIPPATDIERERAAYLIGKRMGVNVPETFVKENHDSGGKRMTLIDPGEGRWLVQKWVDDNRLFDSNYEIEQFARGDVGGSLPLDHGALPLAQVRERAAEVRRIGLFDAVIGNLDRHMYNVLVTPAEGEGQHVWAIDHGLSFPEANAEGSYTDPFIGHNNVRLLEAARMVNPHLTDEEKRLLRSLQTPDVAHELRSAGLNDQAMTGMYSRIDEMLKTGELPEVDDEYAYDSKTDDSYYSGDSLGSRGTNDYMDGSHE